LTKITSNSLEVIFVTRSIFITHFTRIKPMRTATPNLLVLTVQTGTDRITGTAIDGDVGINFAVTNSDVNRRLFVPEAQLVVTGKFRLGKEFATIGILISNVVAIISIPAPASAEIADPANVLVATPEFSTEVEVVVQPELTTTVEENIAPKEPPSSARSQTRAQKAAATRAANKAKTKAESLPC
jgi:hypothetical protein